MTRRYALNNLGTSYDFFFFFFFFVLCLRNAQVIKNSDTLNTDLAHILGK